MSYLVGDRLDPALVNLRRVDDIEAKRIGILRSQSDLHGSRGIDDAALCRPVKHRAVIDTVVLVVPGIAMGVKMQQRQRSAMLARMRLQQGIGNEVVPAQRQQCRAGIDDFEGARFDRSGDAVGLSVVEKTVADIGDCQLVERIESHAVRFFPGHD